MAHSLDQRAETTIWKTEYQLIKGRLPHDPKLAERFFSKPPPSRLLWLEPVSKVFAEGTEGTKRLAAKVVPDLLLSTKLPLSTAVRLGTEALRFTESPEDSNWIYALLVCKIHHLVALERNTFDTVDADVIDAGVAILGSEGASVALDPSLKDNVLLYLLRAVQNLTSQPDAHPLLTLRQGLKEDLAFLNRVDRVLIHSLFEISEKSPYQAFLLAHDIWKDLRTTPENKAACETYLENARSADYAEGHHSEKLSMVLDTLSQVGKSEIRKQEKGIRAVTGALVHVEASGAPAVFRTLREGGDESLDQKVSRAFNFLSEAYQNVPDAGTLLEESLREAFRKLRTVRPHVAVRAGQSLFEQAQKRESKHEPDFSRLMQQAALSEGVAMGTVQLHSDGRYSSFDVADVMSWLSDRMGSRCPNFALPREAFQSVAEAVPPETLIHFLRTAPGKQACTLAMSELSRRLEKGGSDAVEALETVTSSPFSSPSLVRCLLGKTKAARTACIQAICG